jgi:hypothetical protein
LARSAPVASTRSAGDRTARYFYFGSVGGGVWKTINAGRTWIPYFRFRFIGLDRRDRVAPSDPNTIYVGTGEADMRDSIQFGDGMYRSNDGGKTWKHVGLEGTKQIGRIIVDPKNSNLFTWRRSVMLTDQMPIAGSYRTHDGGVTWEKVLFKNNDVGAIDLNFDPTNSQTIYAALWNVRRPPWFIYAPANGPGGGIFKSTNGGRPGNKSMKAFRSTAAGALGFPFRPQTATASTPRWTRRTAAFFARTMRFDLDQAFQRQAPVGPRLVL